MLRSVFCFVVAFCSSGWCFADKIDYKPISTEADNLGRLEKYGDIERKTVELELDGVTLKAQVPVRGNAYDAVPIEYELIGQPGSNDRVAVEVTAFEDDERRNGNDVYDLALPGKIDLKVEYLGSQTGHFDPSRVERLTATSKHETYPPYNLDPLVRSSHVKRGNYLFFKFRITNAGNTILDPEGFGGWMIRPEAQLLGEDGKPAKSFKTINGHERTLKYVYPGESFEQWFAFGCGGYGHEYTRTLPVGKYNIRIIAEYRYNKEYNWIVNMWGGKGFCGYEFPLEVSEQGGEAAFKGKLVKYENDNDLMTRWVRSLEEFMTSFTVYEKGELSGNTKGKIHIQVAPWTKHVILKLIGNKPGEIKTLVVPMDVTNEGLDIQRNPKNPFVVKDADGKDVPLFVSQMMPAMRSNVQIGPNPEKHLRERLAEAMDCGLNTIASTAGDWHNGQVYNPQAYVGDVLAESFKHYHDVIAPESGVNMFAWAFFPAKTWNAKAIGEMVLGKKFNIPTTDKESTTYSHHPELDIAHPDWAKAYAAAITFNYGRWGHLWYRTADGEMPIDMEDSWGWLRDDINIRYCLGPYAIKGFQDWCKRRYYRQIERVNKAWGSDYKTFEEINPQANQGDEGKAYGIDLSHLKPVYNKDDNVFHDWSPALNDWDTYRTELRCKIYGDIQRYIRRDIPKAYLNIRTEGAVIPVSVPADSKSAHLRHIYHVQRRQALVSEVLQEKKTLRYHSDYTTMPYTESEWRMLLGKLREEGIRGNYLPQFCTARDMVFSDEYGRDYARNYGFDKPQRAVMLHVLQAAFPVWRIMYEEGHAPGVLWEDFMCDGFVTETQKHELRVFRSQLNKMK